MSTKVDIDHLRKWIGKIDNVTDYVTPIVEQRYRATLNTVSYTHLTLPTKRIV